MQMIKKIKIYKEKIFFNFYFFYYKGNGWSKEVNLSRSEYYSE